MNKQEFSTIHKRMRAAFPGVISEEKETLAAWFSVVSDLEYSQVDKAAAILIRETESLRPGTNLGAVLRNRAQPTMTAMTIEGHLNHALFLNRQPNGNPYSYLGQINKRLLEMAENADLFNPGLSQDAVGIRVHKTAGQFVEELENTKKGFTRPVQQPLETKALEQFERKPNPYKGLSIGEAAKQAALDLERMRAAKEKALEPRKDAA